MKLDSALRDGKFLSEDSTQSINNSYIDSRTVFGFPSFSYSGWIKTDDVLGSIAMHPDASPGFSSLLIRGIDRNFTLVVLFNVSSVANVNIYTEGLLQLIDRAKFLLNKSTKIYLPEFKDK